MAGTAYVDCVGPSYHLADKQASVQSAVNCFPQQLDAGRWVLRSAPGYTTFDGLTGPFRGSKALESRWFVVAGNTLYMRYADADFVAVGTLLTSTGYAGIAVNQSQVAVVDGDNLYIFNYLTNTFTLVASPGWRGSNDVFELDGYFIFVDPNSDQFYVSAIDDGTNLSALDFSSADSSPDTIMCHRVSHRQLLLFGAGNSTEIWVDSGELAFPFTRYNSYTLDIGCVGKRAAVNAADTVFWIGKTDRGTGIVYMLQGNQPQRVSTIAVEQALRTSTDLSGAWLWSYQTEGHEFVGIEAPGMSTTWVYDAATQQWHERAKWVDGWQPLGFQFVTHYAVNGQATHWAAEADGLMYTVAPEANTIGALPLVRERTWPHLVSPSSESLGYRGVEISCATGSQTLGSMTLEISNDGGITFGPPLLRALGAIGRFMQRVRWLGLGRSFNRVFRIRCSDDVPFTIYSATVDAG